jgi:hypothetical protein
MIHLCGWKDDPRERDRIWESMPTPFFQAPAPSDADAMNHLIFKEFTGSHAPDGPQKIGDCVSWGNGNLVNYTNVLEAWVQLQEKKAREGLDDTQYAAAADEARYLYEEACTEAIYGLSRVNIGGEHGSYQDGSVGAWAAKALVEYGAISRKQMDRMGKSGTYDGKRAKEWGAKGLPSDIEAEAKNHPMADTTPVNSFNDLRFHHQNYRVVAVCSNVGFQNGSGQYTTMRDSQGFSKPRGSWPHCMIFVSSKGGSRPGALLLNQWGPNVVGGPMGDVEIPPCSWWVDADVVDKMLKQKDSFTGTKYKGYPARVLSWRF